MLLAVPALVARAATVVCVGGGAGLLLAAFRLASEPGGPQDAEVPEGVDDEGGDLAHRIL